MCQLKYRPTCPSCGKFVEKTSLIPNLSLSAAVRVADFALNELDKRDEGPSLIERVIAAMKSGGESGGSSTPGTVALAASSSSGPIATTEDPNMNIEQLSKLKRAIEEKIAMLKVSYSHVQKTKTLCICSSSSSSFGICIDHYADQAHPFLHLVSAALLLVVRHPLQRNTSEKRLGLILQFLRRCREDTANTLDNLEKGKLALTGVRSSS